MITALVQPLFRWLRLSLAPPAPVAGAQPRQVLQPSRRIHQLHLLQWAGAQLSALVGVALVLFAFDLTQWLPRWFSFLEFFSYWDDITDFLPAEWRWIGGALTVGGFLVQLPVTFLAVWSETRTTWYVISDQGVQLQHGVWTTHETSLRFANLQQVTFRQSLLQRLIGLADVVVSTAGGRRSSDEDEDGKRKNQGRLRDLDYAEAQRLLETLRGQLDTSRAPVALAPPPSVPALEAARHLLAETQALRRSLEARASRPPAQLEEPLAPVPTDPASDP